MASRIGLNAEAVTFTQSDNLLDRISAAHRATPLHCVLVDEAQFLTRQHVRQLSDVVDDLDIPVLAYGLRTDFKGNMFEGSQNLLAWADSLTEIKTICHCGRKATMVLRLGEDGKPVRDGAQVKIGGNETYQSVCSRHFKDGIATRQANQLQFKD